MNRTPRNRHSTHRGDGVLAAARLVLNPSASRAVLSALVVVSAIGLPATLLRAQNQPAEPPAQPETSPAAEKLPKLAEMQLPSAEELLTRTVPQDWIVLKTTEVIVCESVVPRPDTLNLRQQEIKALLDSRAGKSKDEVDEINRKVLELGDLVITIPGDMENPEYRLDLRRIDRIMHHEDLMLQRIDQLARDGDLEPGYELLWRLERNWPEWPGLRERHDNLLFADGNARLAAGNAESALVAYNELQQRAANYPGLADQMGQAIDQIVSRALAAADYRQARYFLLRLDRVFPGHAVFQSHAGEMARRAEELLSQGDQARRDGKHPDAAELARQAAELWPRTPNLLPRVKPLLERYQRLHVGVVDLSTDVSPSPYRTAAQVRADHLMHTPLFELERVKGGNVYYRARYFDEWEPYDLGRLLRITFRQVRQPWEAQPLVDAPSVAALIERQIDPESEDFNERLASYVASVQVESPVALTLRFRRVPARVEPLLDELVPSSLPPESNDGDAVVTTSAGGFTPADVQADQVVFRRDIPEPDGLPQYHVAEVIEHRYASHEKALQALREGEVSLLPDLPDWIMRRLLAETDFQKEYFIQKYSLPLSHVIQFNPRSTGLRVREMRRALAYAIDRDKILRETVLRDPNAEHGRITTSPFPSSSSANSVDVEPHEFNLTSALAMVLAARRQMGDAVPALKMIVPAGPVERAAAADIIRIWKRIGVDVELLEQPPGEDAPPAEWDLQYRTLQMLEPTVELWPFLAATNQAQISDLTPFPDWLKQQLVTVDRTSDWALALDATRRLHEVLSDDVRFIPLWEVDGFLVVRKNIQGFPESPLHCYQHLDNWTMNAWYRAE
jgi:hypothetical protein